MTARALLATTVAFLLSSISLHATVPAPAEHPAENSATVLCYHIVESPLDARMEVSRETFRQQMRYLALTGYNVIPLRELYEYVSGKRSSIPKNAIVITIDDGWRSAYTEVFPEMQKRHFPFTVFLYPKIIGQTANALTWKQVKELSDAGVDVQSHTLSHPFLTQRRHTSLDEKKYADWLQTELVESKRILEHQTGHSVSFLAYPYGDYDSHVAQMAARAGYAAALTCDYGRVKKGSDPLKMKRVAIEKSMDFAMFRRLLGASPMPIQDVTPLPDQSIDPGQPSVMISARLPNYKSLDPKSVGIAVMSMGTVPYQYDPRDGSITLVLRDAAQVLKGKMQRALVWATDAKSGRRVEASWVFKLPDVATPALPGAIPPIVPNAVPVSAPADPTIDPKPADGPIPGMQPLQIVTPASTASTVPAGTSVRVSDPAKSAVMGKSPR